MRCYLFDIDGTLANGDHRLHLIRPDGDPQFKPRWDEYFMACGEDTPHEHICELARALWSSATPIVYVSGRSEMCQQLTIDWLAKNDLPIFTSRNGKMALYMRQQGDHKNDDLLKLELLVQLRKDGFEPIMAFDDRDRVVKAWRAAGVPCAQVAEGDF